MTEWTHISNKLPPENEILIGISSFDDKRLDWICIGSLDKAYKYDLNELDYRTNFKTTVGYGVHSIKCWHPIPKLPWEIDGEWYHDEEWIDCKEFKPPSYRSNPITFILFDGKEGIAEAEYWGGYQSDTWSCKHGFDNPLFWRPFPRLPLESNGVLQI